MVANVGGCGDDITVVAAAMDTAIVLRMTKAAVTVADKSELMAVAAVVDAEVEASVVAQLFLNQINLFFSLCTCADEKKTPGVMQCE